MADSESVRQWIIEAYGRNKTTGEIAAVFGRCPSGVRRVKQQARERGDALPRFHLRGSKGKFTPERQAKLREWIAQKPDQTLEELRVRFEEELKVKVSKSTIDRWTKKLGLTFKKSPFTPPNRTGPMSKHDANAGTTI